MIFYIYRIVNKINQHYYIGRRAYQGVDISDDEYFGSGKRLKLAIAKYGKENFIKEIVSIHQSVEDLILAEKNLITEDLIKDVNCYNLAIGGHGGFTYYEERIFNHTDEAKAKISKQNKGRPRPDASARNKENGFNKHWAGKERSAVDKASKSAAAKKAYEEKRHAACLQWKCPHCDKEGTGTSNKTRWHFDNCREKLK